MGLEVVVARTAPCPLGSLLDRLKADGITATLAMVDGVLQGPGATPPAAWRDARLRTPAGMVALRRASAGIVVVVFGNADAALQAMQRRIADTLRQLP